MLPVTRKLIWVVAGLHLIFMGAEIFFWETLTPLLHVYDETKAGITAAVGRNMGLYNGILAGGLIGALLAPGLSESHRKGIAIYLLVGIVLAGIFGGITINWTIPLFQSVPALIAFFLCLKMTPAQGHPAAASLHGIEHHS